jgi:hypothetical protein
MSKETFYDYNCNSCDASYKSNQLERECFYCGANALKIVVKRPLVIRIKEKTSQEQLNEALDAMSSPDYDWEYEINKGR